MSWTELATSTHPGGELALYVASDGAYMIRANGRELMNGRCHRSEDVLGALAARLARRAARHGHARLLIGGLGLGFTLAAAARALGGAGAITVAEISASVIAWYERYCEPALFSARPSNISLVEADVAKLLREARPGSYHVIVLDIDNGPEPLAAEGNEYLYSVEGLRAVSSALTEKGILLIWSGFEAAAFCGRAKQADFDVSCEKIAIPQRPELFHSIFRLAKR